MYSKYSLFVILVVLTAVSTACSSQPPVIQGMELDSRPSEAVPLAAQVTFETDR